MLLASVLTLLIFVYRGLRCAIMILAYVFLLGFVYCIGAKLQLYNAAVNVR